MVQGWLLNDVLCFACRLGELLVSDVYGCCFRGCVMISVWSMGLHCFVSFAGGSFIFYDHVWWLCFFAQTAILW